MSIETLINKRNADNQAWKEARQAERDEVSALRDAGIMDVTSEPHKYMEYLDIQAQNPIHSAGNVILAMYQFPQGFTVFHTAEEWKELGRFVTPTELRGGAKVFKREGNFYNVADAYDLSQTQGRALKELPLLTEGTPEMQTALDTLLRYAQKLRVPVTLDEKQTAAAYYDDRYCTLVVNPGAGELEQFAGMARELTLAKLHDRGYNPDFVRSDYEFDADSATYLVCKRFGVPCDPPKTVELADAYPEGFDAKGRGRALDAMQDAARAMVRNIQYRLDPPTQTRGRFQRQDRQR